MRVRMLILAVLVALVVGCTGSDEREAPVRALLAFVAALERSASEPDYREQAYELLDSGSRQELERRAALARSLAGRELEAWEMLAPGRLTVSTRELRREALTAEVEGDQASVTIGGAEPIVLVREEGQWRVRLFEAGVATR